MYSIWHIRSPSIFLHKKEMCQKLGAKSLSFMNIRSTYFHEKDYFQYLNYRYSNASISFKLNHKTYIMLNVFHVVIQKIKQEIFSRENF